MMKTHLLKYKKWLFPGAFMVFLLGLGLIVFGMHQTVTILVDDKPVTVQTMALRVVDILNAAGLTPADVDWVRPGRDRWVWKSPLIRVESAQDIIVVTDEEEITLSTAERIPANLIQKLDITLYPEDRVLVNGVEVAPDEPLNGNGFILLQYKPAIPIQLIIDDQELSLYTSEPTLGAALEAAEISLGPMDWISKDLLTPLDEPLEVHIRQARPITVRVDDTTLSGFSAATIVGDALLDIGVSLQNLDFTKPKEDQPVPTNGQIDVIRVEEAVMIMTDEVAYQNAYVEDPDTLLDQVSVVEPGQKGIYASRERVQMVGGEIVWQDEQQNWQASEAEDGVLGYGSRVEVRTAVVDGQEIEYWRKIRVYATSYSPCRCATPDGRCCYSSSSGLPSQKGMIAVTLNWYRMMKLQPVYVQGYGHGVIGNVGGGARYFDHYWIDLGYSDDDYQSWHHWTTMYFLTPVPAWYPARLPWP